MLLYTSHKMETALLYTVDTECGLLLSDMVWEQTQTVEAMRSTDLKGIRLPLLKTHL